VPSACSKWPPVGSGGATVKDADVSRTEEASSNTFLPKRSLRFTHQVKFSKSLLNVALRKSRSASPRSALFGSVQESVANAVWTGDLRR